MRVVSKSKKKNGKMIVIKLSISSILVNLHAILTHFKIRSAIADNGHMSLII